MICGKENFLQGCGYWSHLYNYVVDYSRTSKSFEGNLSKIKGTPLATTQKSSTALRKEQSSLLSSLRVRTSHLRRGVTMRRFISAGSWQGRKLEGEESHEEERAFSHLSSSFILQGEQRRTSV